MADRSALDARRSEVPISLSALSRQVFPGTTTTRDGVSLAYAHCPAELQGAPRFVLVHSIGLSYDAWAPLVALAPDLEIVALDCRGHGRSQRVAGPYFPEQLADDVVTVMDVVGWRDATVVGASMGGVVAQAVALTHPARVSGLGLIDTTAWYGPESARQWEKRREQALSFGLAEAIGFQLERWFSQPFRDSNPTTLEALVEIFTSNTPECFAAACRMLGEFDFRGRLDQVDQPTAVVVGSEDFATPPAMSEVLHGLLVGSSLTVIPQTRHLTFIESPVHVLAAVRRSLGSDDDQAGWVPDDAN